MTREEIKEAVIRILAGIAPETDPGQIKPDISLREQLDIDSMDFLNFVIALHQQLKLEIPETDYSKLSTLDNCVRYLESALSSG
jgi:acyl carrier protein